MERYLSLDAQTLSGLRSGEIATRLDEDVNGLFQYYYILFFKLAGSGLALVGILASLVRQSGTLSAALFAVSVLAILGFKAIQDRGMPKYVRSSAAAAEYNGTVKEILDASPAIRALRAEEFAQERAAGAMRHRYFESFPASLMYGNLWSASTLMQGAVLACGLLFALALRDRGAISVGTAYLIYSYSEMVTEPLQDFRNHMGNMQSFRAGIERTLPLLSMPARGKAGGRPLSPGAVSVRVENLRFSYRDGGEALRGVSLYIPSGKRLGIMGETGCGKSTLLRLIAGLNDYDEGKIELSGAEPRDIDAESLSRGVGYCDQRAQLIHGTLRENIAFFDSRYTDADMLSAINRLGLADWLAKFPLGLDTRLEFAEGSVSSGEARLITLVRLALIDPGLMLLDEITADLDAETEARVSEAVAALCADRTVIAIAHRLESLRWMDEIALMEDGVIVGREGGAAE